jgi:hypothetical protein
MRNGLERTGYIVNIESADVDQPCRPHGESGGDVRSSCPGRKLPTGQEERRKSATRQAFRWRQASEPVRFESGKNISVSLILASPWSTG